MKQDSVFKKALGHWDHFFFAPVDTTICAVVRIGFGLVLLPYVFVLGLDLPMLFGEQGVLPFEVSRALVDQDVLSPLGILAPNDTALWFCFWIFCIQVLLLIFGVKSRFQAFGVLFWLIAFQHRNNLTIDGGDTLARLTAFYLWCMPCGERFSMDQRWRSRRGIVPRFLPIWGLKLLQIQMTLLYASTAILKLQGEEWLNGTALMYVVQLHDVYGRLAVPEFIFGSLDMLKLLTWTVLVVEVLIPIGLWIRSTRIFTVCFAMLFHLSLDYSMNLFLFQWFMMVGLLSFCTLETVPLSLLMRWFNSDEEAVKV